ncbi:hypothetical protein BH09PSE5_BH09PSE5_30980 [soil metagenome]
MNKSNEFSPEVRERAVRMGAGASWGSTGHCGWPWMQPERDRSLVIHSDRGSQYVSIRYSEQLAEAGVEPSVGSKGDSYDNALAETINGLYKAELIHRRAQNPGRFTYQGDDELNRNCVLVALARAKRDARRQERPCGGRQ